VELAVVDRGLFILHITPVPATAAAAAAPSAAEEVGIATLQLTEYRWLFADALLPSHCDAAASRLSIDADHRPTR